MIIKNLKKHKISWKKTDSHEYPYQAQIEDKKLEIRINDFPENALYSLILNGVVVDSFDDWPNSWSR